MKGTIVSLLLSVCCVGGSTVTRQHQHNTQSSSLVSFPGAKAVIPGWRLQSVLNVEDNNLTILSHPDYDASSWYCVGSRATVMAGLIENGVYNDTELFYSNNLQAATIIQNRTVFQAPWLYREELVLEKFCLGQHVFVNTHGITAQADIVVNGVLVASRDVQQGSFGGHRYEVTPYLLEGKNCILVKAYPANYDKDFVIGFADWNPYPPDNGTGIWRNVELLRTGAVSISSPRVITSMSPDMTRADITIKMEIDNHEQRAVSGTVNGIIRLEEDQEQDFPLFLFETFTLQMRESRTITVKTKLDNPQVWWPASWGKQPLYMAQFNATVSNTDGTADANTSILSDIGETRNFGIRHVASHLNEHNDRAFTVNGRPFLVLGAGYSPDYFLRFDENRVRAIFGYMLDLGLNTVRLEGKLEHPEFYDLADRMGIMVMAGWECCDKWEAFDYNDDVNATRWADHDYTIANHSMLHEANQMQTHPSILAFLVGSDYWPNDTATKTYLSALHQKDWNAPIIASASQRGHPGELLEDSGMKMAGPYDWVPPNYWYQEDEDDAEGAAFGFGSELGAGVGTPELNSLVKFLSEKDLMNLWTEPNQGLFHMSNEGSQFWKRGVYNTALRERYGEPGSLVDYVFKAQVMDYEATRAQFEAFSIRQSAERPATGMIYWMLNSAWPNLHWQLFDYYLNPGGAYFGTKIGCRTEHVAFDYVSQGVYIINHTPGVKAWRDVTIDVIDINGRFLFHDKHRIETSPFSSKLVMTIPEFDGIELVFVKLVLADPLSTAEITGDDVTGNGNAIGKGNVLSRNIYWLSPKQKDELDPDNATWYTTSVSDYADFASLSELSQAKVKTSIVSVTTNNNSNDNNDDDEHAGKSSIVISLENESDSVPAFFMRLALLDARTGQEILPVSWEDNYVTLWPRERADVVASVGFVSLTAVSRVVLGVVGGNVEVNIEADGEIYLQRGCC